MKAVAFHQGVLVNNIMSQGESIERLVSEFEQSGDFAKARETLVNAMQSSKDLGFIRQCNEKLKSYQDSMKGKEEHEEFLRLSKSSQLVEGSLWHLVSKTWLKSWEEHLLWENAVPGPISNLDIIEEKKDFLMDSRPHKLYTNTLLKAEAREKVDFEILSKSAYVFLDKRYNNDGTSLKRWAISLNDDGSGLHIELHLKPIKLILIPKGTSNQFLIYMSRIENILSLKEKLFALLPNRLSQELRIWKTSTIQDFSLLFSSSKYTINGKILKDVQMIEDCEIAEEDFLIAEFKKKNNDWVLYKPGEICAYCKESGNLQNCSSCKMVKYCSRPCQISDFPMHKDLCKRFREKTIENSGVVGLQNLGNTCFMNAALQCVLHSMKLKDYFLTQRYKSDLNLNNPLGTKNAALAQAFAEVVENVWLGNDKAVSPWTFKKTISKFAPQFIGYEQHDSHELLTYLLTGLHEDLNRVKVKPYIEKPDVEEMTDEKASAVSWTWFLERNQSTVVDLMYGQMKSTLKCPDCEKTSITFDPLLTFSVNLPSSQKNSYTILLVLMNNKIFKQEIEVLLGSNVLKMKQTLMEKFKIRNIAICYYNNLNVQGLCDDYSEVSDYKNKTFIGFECANDIKNRVPIPVKIYFSDGKTQQLVTFTRLLFVKSETTYMKIHKMLKQMVPGKTKVNIINTAGYSGIFNKTRLACDFCHSPSCTNCPLAKSSKTIKETNDQMKNSEGLFMLEILVPRENPFLENCNELIETEIILEQCFTDSKLTLQNCLEYSMRPETLDMHNEWYCPTCKKNVQALKSFQIYKAPEILIFHLMRFKNRGVFSQKINEIVVFPIKGLVIETLENGHSQKIYDLYAVCNHFGGMGGGHYTAYIESMGKWYHMDDANTGQVPEEKVVSSAAYILFYKLRE